MTERKYHYTYRITHLDTGLFYEGVRSSEASPAHDTGYMGSGARMREALAAFGPDAFKKTVLKTFGTRELAMAGERRLVTRTKLQDPLCLNLCVGGNGQLQLLTKDERCSQFYSQVFKIMQAAGFDRKKNRRRYPVFKTRYENLLVVAKKEIVDEHFYLLPDVPPHLMEQLLAERHNEVKEYKIRERVRARLPHAKL